MAESERAYSYSFQDEALETLALTHSSCDLETGDNQRLEFLGDAVLDLVIAEYLYLKFPDANEGALDRTRAAIVNGHTLATVAREIGISPRLKLGESQIQHNPEPTKAMLEDSLEALIGAIYLDGGPKSAQDFIKSAFNEILQNAEVKEDRRNPKTKLQEWTQAQNDGQVPEYQLIDTEGPAHKRSYHVAVYLNNEELGKGVGSSKKQAETAAADAALRALLGNE